MSDTVQIVLLLLLASMTLGVLARRVGIPYPIALTLGGLAMSFVPGLPDVRLNPDIVFAVFLPPILYRAALFERWHDFRAHLRPIGMLAVGLVIFTTVAVAVVLHAIVPGVPWAAAFILGAIVSPPDAVAVTAILNRLHLPTRIIAVIEGESLVNDATAIILYKAALVALLTGAFSAGDAALGFVGVSVGGAAIGLAVGWVSVHIHRVLKDTLSETMLSLAVPYVTYGLADSVEVSGVLAVIAVGLWRSFAGHTVLSAETRQHTFGMWDVVVFFLNSLVFTLIGLQLPPAMEGLENFSPLTLLGYAVAISLTVIVARILWVFPMAYGPHLFKRGPLPPWRGVALISYVGMRGIVSLAVAMALPLTGPDGGPFPAHGLIVFLTFSVIVATLVVQGLTLPTVLHWLGFAAPAGPVVNDAERLARLKMAFAAVAEVNRLAERDGLPPRLVEPVRTEFAAPLAEPDVVPGYSADALDDAQRTLRLAGVAAARRRLVKLHRTDEIDDALLQMLQRELDFEELRAQGASTID